MKNNKNLHRQKQEDAAEARGDFWSIQGDFIYRHHVEPRVQLHVRKEETYPDSLKYVDVKSGRVAIKKF